MKRYPRYKQSHVQWFGEIPETWDIIKLKFLTSVITKGTTPSTVGKDFVSEGINYLKVESISNVGTILKEKCSFIDRETHKILHRSQLQESDIVISIAGAIGRVAIIDKEILPANTNQAVGIIRLRKRFNNQKWITYLLNSEPVLNHYKLEVVETAQANLSLENVGIVDLTIPSIPEQHSIVRFLDHRTGQMDRFITNRQKQIELLKEQKAGIINKAVTKGINPKAKMNPSGIEWLKEVPEHWMVGKVRRVLDILTDFTANGSFADLAKNVKYLDTPDYSRLIRLTDLREDLKNDGIYVSKEAHAYLSKSVIYGGEILMANVGAYAGLVCLVPKIDFAATLGPNMFLLKFEEKRMSNQYAFTLLGSDCYCRILMNKALSSAQPKLNKEDVKSIDFIFPPTHKEQQEILDFIQAETSNIDSLISKYQKQIDLMQEYRTALISQAVTGKIDVREWQPKSKKYETEELPVSMAAEN